MKRIALISDIHGNAVALEAVLDDLAGRRAAELVCLADVAAGGPLPREALARLPELGCPVVLGNADGWLLEGVPSEPGQEEPAASGRACSTSLSMSGVRGKVRACKPRPSARRSGSTTVAGDRVIASRCPTSASQISRGRSSASSSSTGVSSTRASAGQSAATPRGARSVSPRSEGVLRAAGAAPGKRGASSDETTIDLHTPRFRRGRTA
jgi:hypothetical protein